MENLIQCEHGKVEWANSNTLNVGTQIIALSNPCSKYFILKQFTKKSHKKHASQQNQVCCWWSKETSREHNRILVQQNLIASKPDVPGNPQSSGASITSLQSQPQLFQNGPKERWRKNHGKQHEKNLHLSSWKWFRAVISEVMDSEVMCASAVLGSFKTLTQITYEYLSGSTSPHCPVGRMITYIETFNSWGARSIYNQNENDCFQLVALDLNDILKT